KISKPVGKGRRAERGAQILERIVPTELDAIFRVLLDTARGNLLGGAIAGSGDDKGTGLFGPQMMHIGHDGGTDRTANQDGVLARIGIIDRFPASLRHIFHSEAFGCGWRPSIARNIDRYAPKPGRKMRHLKYPG